MTISNLKNSPLPASVKEDGPIGPQSKPENDDACRCKEVSQKTPRELLRLMFQDLTFWKKTSKD